MRRRGNILLESAMLMPVIILLLVGMVQIARFTYIYFALRQAAYAVASYVSSQQAVNFCDPGDQTITSAINYAMTGTVDNSAPVTITGLTAAMFSVVPERFDNIAQAIETCSCDVTGCDESQGGTKPDYITVSISGYQFTPRIPFLPSPQAINLSPSVKVPYGGT